MVSWNVYFDFDAQLIHYDFDFTHYHPLVALKAFGTGSIEHISTADLFIGKQVGGIGATCGLALLIGGIYLILRGYVRWQIPVSFIVGLCVTAAPFQDRGPSPLRWSAFPPFVGFFP